MLTSVSGASDVFMGGITAYQRSIKVEQLDVDDILARRTDGVDEEVARQMALGALKLFHTDYALATCGYAERKEGNPYAFYAIAGAANGILISEHIELKGSRTEAQDEAARTVLEAFCKLLGDKAGDQQQ